MNIKELAKKLDLSITTVSRALGGYPDVSDKTRKKVEKFARKYKYSPNPNASRLASGRSNTVGFVIPLYGLNSNNLNQTSFFDFISGTTNKIHSENVQFFLMFANSVEDDFKNGKMPNLKGMNLKDVSFLLEKYGLIVKVSGTGAVLDQSIKQGKLSIL